MRRYALAAVVVLTAVLLMVGIQASRMPAVQQDSAAATGQPHFPAPVHLTVGGSAPVLDGERAAALARAIAVLGQYADGTIRALPTHLDAETRAALPEAEALLATHRPLRTPGRTYETPDGATMRVAPPEHIHPISGDIPDLADRGPVEIGVGQTDAGTGASRGEVRHDGDRVTVTGDGVWAALTWEPGQPAVRLREAASPSHAIRIHAEDPSGLRINGGLVVPGRHYRIGDGLHIQSAAPIGIDIVPLDATHLVYDQPIPMPPIGPG